MVFNVFVNKVDGADRKFLSVDELLSHLDEMEAFNGGSDRRVADNWFVLKRDLFEVKNRVEKEEDVPPVPPVPKGE